MDSDGEEIAIPAPGETWLRVTAVPDPEVRLSTQPRVVLAFDQYLDPATFSTFGALQLRSGGYVYGGRTEYFMTRRELHFRPNASLEPELQYQIALPGAERLRSVVGSPLHPLTLLPHYLADEGLPQEEPIRRPSVSWEEVEALFIAHCTSCHGDPDWRLPDLSRESLVGIRSTQASLPLVEPFSPARSYLMHKLLPDYPERRYTVQPPPWSGADPLPQEEIERIEHWIANGARP